MIIQLLLKTPVQLQLYRNVLQHKTPCSTIQGTQQRQARWHKPSAKPTHRCLSTISDTFELLWCSTFLVFLSIFVSIITSSLNLVVVCQQGCRINEDTHTQRYVGAKMMKLQSSLLHSLVENGGSYSYKLLSTITLILEGELCDAALSFWNGVILSACIQAILYISKHCVSVYMHIRMHSM